jgi:hypothetical protein
MAGQDSSKSGQNFLIWNPIRTPIDVKETEEAGKKPSLLDFRKPAKLSQSSVM